MKLTALAVVILALGIVGGFALAGGASGGPASAVPQCPGPSSQCATPTPAPPQQREDQVVIFAQRGGASILGPTFSGLNPAGPVIVAFDPADYPSAATFRFEAVWTGVFNVETCARLFDVTASAPVAGAEVCHTHIGGDQDVRIRSAPITLPAGEHEYNIEGKSDDSAPVGAARIIVEWTE